MADRPDPYVRKDPNDIIRSGDWNELQIQTREEILKHTHTGRDDGRLIPGKAIDPTADISVSTLNTSGNLNVGGDLKVNGKALLGDIADLLATVKGLQDDKLSRAGGERQWQPATGQELARRRHRRDRKQVDRARRSWRGRCPQGSG
ncbi:hypothetical protein E4Q08_22315 [Candidatus Accumulibacter phosphatis]|uniref:Uncharacterized protein n=1 Tax=Candidatus Accumulibacter contiguus TaxID=2954381 RepID=A0ABX1TDK0_9PROT|nr:hypothetical protein [Candidatus Accumulibacter contiguus]NMQ07775.1 hypothetical protein [Candidatus Accumulibacter contiguus]